MLDQVLILVGLSFSLRIYSKEKNYVVTTKNTCKTLETKR